MITIWEPILTQIAVIYLGASFDRTMKLPAMPPRPLQAVIAAANVARFHWPTMLLAWYALVCVRVCVVHSIQDV